MDKEKQTPALRFCGFTGPWEKKSLLDNVHKIIDFRGRTPKKLGMDWSESGYLALSALNVKNGYIDFTQDVHYGNQQLYDAWMTGNELHRGQVLFTTEAPMGNVAQIPDERKYILSQRTIAFELNPTLVTEDFWAVLLSSPHVFAELTSLSSGGTAKGISQRSMEAVTVFIPSNLDEQKHISQFFLQLNEKIISLEQKIKKAEQFRRAMLLKLFPAEGASEPALRFRGFSGAWKKCKLASFGKATGGVSLEAEFIENGTYKVINIGSYSGESKYIDQGLRTNKTKRTAARILNKNDLVMILNDKTSEGNIIGRVLLIDADDTYVYNQRNERIEVNQSQFVPQFLYELLNADVVRNKIIRAAQGATQIYVNWSVISQLTYMIPPSINEQKQIGDFFYQLDSYISLQREKREKLRRLKAALLEKLFV